jgi:broad specificity phosphatase PhoE
MGGAEPLTSTPGGRPVELPQSLDFLSKAADLKHNPETWGGPGIDDVPTIYLVRHGKTALNNDTDTSQDRIRGWTDVPLSEEGRAEAHRLATEFRGLPIGSVYASDLGRAAETAQLLSKGLGSPQVKLVQGLRPWHLGDFAGQPATYVQPHVERYVREFPDKPVPGGESFQQFVWRLLDETSKLMAEATANPALRVVAVAHFRCLKLVQAWFDAGLGDKVNLGIFFRNDVPVGTVVKLFKQEGKDWTYEVIDTMGTRGEKKSSETVDIPESVRMALPEVKVKVKVKVKPSDKGVDVKVKKEMEKKDDDDEGEPAGEKKSHEHFKPASKVTREAFLYAEPKPGSEHPELFAQCATCWKHDGERRCHILPAELDVGPKASCNYYEQGEPGKKFAVSLPVLTAEEAGLVRRPVRCENCAHVDKEGGYCELYKHLNELLPDVFDLKQEISPHGCCAANTAQAGAEKAAGKSAPGIPDRDRFASPETLPVGELVTYARQAHDAARAGKHTDLRLGTPEHGLISWAIRKGLPEPGKKHLAVEQPTHAHDYAKFQGTIPAGEYGAGTVKREDLGEALVTRATPDSVHATLAHKGDPVRLMLHRMKGGNPRHWLLQDTTLTPDEAVKFPKVRYKDVPAEKGEELLKNMPEGSSAQAKIDGAAAFLKLMKHGPEVFSYRTDTRGHPITHTERVLGGRPESPTLPKSLEGSVLRGEIYGTRGEEAIPPQELGGILNSSVARALKTKQERGIDLRTLLFDVKRLGQKDVPPETPYAERRKMIDQVLEHLPQPAFHAPEEAKSPEEAVNLLRDVLGGKHPLTREGVVLHSPTGAPTKIKARGEHDVHVSGFFPAEAGSKYHNKAVGGFYYSHEPGGEVAGKVGTGISDELRADMHLHPEKYLGRVARVLAQDRFPSGALRAPSLLALHEG